MQLQELIDFSARELISKIESSEALGIFARERAKFEGWLKVELVDILRRKGLNAVPEHGRIDVCILKPPDEIGYAGIEVGIELKTVTTNYSDEFSPRKIRPITKNIADVIQDIEKYRKNRVNPCEHEFILFVAFPIAEPNDQWRKHLDAIEKALGDSFADPCEFAFSNGVRGLLYYGKVCPPSQKQKLEELQADIAIGMEDIKTGRTIDGERAMAEIHQHLLERVNNEYQ